LPEPSVNVTLLLLPPMVKTGVRTVVVPPAAVVTSDDGEPLSPLRVPPESPAMNDVAAVRLLVDGRFSVPVAVTLLFPVIPIAMVATLVEKLDAADTSSVPVPCVAVFDVPTASVPVPALPTARLAPPGTTSDPPVALAPTFRLPAVLLPLSVTAPAPRLP